MSFIRPTCVRKGNVVVSLFNLIPGPGADRSYPPYSTLHALLFYASTYHKSGSKTWPLFVKMTVVSEHLQRSRLRVVRYTALLNAIELNFDRDVPPRVVSRDLRVDSQSPGVPAS